MRAAASLARKSSTHHMLEHSEAVSSACCVGKMSFDPEVDRGLFPPIALDLVLDSLSLV